MKGKQKPFHIILLGDPTSGKATQAEFLLKKFSHLIRAESGSFLRSQEKSRTRLGSVIRKTVSRGHPAPVWVIKAFLDRVVKRARRTQGVLFDGNPRLLPEAQYLLRLLKKKRLNESVFAFYIRVSFREAARRSRWRYVCVQCGHALTTRTKHPERVPCPVCGGKIEKRWDETAAGLRNRYAYHARQVEETVQYLKQQGIAHIINGEQTRANVHRDIMKVLKELT